MLSIPPSRLLDVPPSAICLHTIVLSPVVSQTRMRIEHAGAEHKTARCLEKEESLHVE